MRPSRLLILTGVLSVYCCTFFQPCVLGSDKETIRMMRDAMQPASTQLEQVNDFIAHSEIVKKKDTKTIQVNNGQIFAKLLTPLNSSFNMTGDDVQAVVINSLSANGKPWLEQGTILEGTVELAKKATYGQTDGSLVIRFYKAKYGEKQIDLYTASDTDDGTIKPSEQKPMTRKQRVRGVLMTVSRIAIPAAIGTSGMSIAISAGAGAAIGLAFSEKGQRIKGTVRGAWEGAGLTILDPLVCKGKTIVLPQGTPIGLQLTEPVWVPPYTGDGEKAAIASDVSDASGRLLSQTAKPVLLETHAQLLNQASDKSDQATTSPIQSDDHLKIVRRKISQNDLAAALTELTAVEELYPNEEEVQKLHLELYELVSGGKKSNNDVIE
jgi:hypothetical protein